MGLNIGPVRSFTQSGRSNMGSIGARFNNIGRFWMPVPKFVLVYYRAIVGQYATPSTAPQIATPTGVDDLIFRVDHAERLSDIGGDGSGGAGTELIKFSFLIRKSPGFGVGNADLNVRLTDEEMQAGAMQAGDVCVALWTNPETTGDLRWCLDVGLAELL